MNTTVSYTEYSKEFRTSCNTGWGCGYVTIPKGHPILIRRLIESNYLYVTGFSYEITYCQNDEEGNLVIGFDTAHSWNNITNSDEQYVIKTTLELKALIDAYTFDDAKKEAQEYLANQYAMLADYL